MINEPPIAYLLRHDRPDPKAASGIVTTSVIAVASTFEEALQLASGLFPRAELQLADYGEAVMQQATSLGVADGEARICAVDVMPEADELPPNAKVVRQLQQQNSFPDGAIGGPSWPRR